MTHFGILCPAAIGHLNPMCVLGRELQRRGHRVTLFGISDIETQITRAGLNFWKVGETEFPPGIQEWLFSQLGKLSGMAGLKFTLDWIGRETSMLFNEAPTALNVAKVEMLLVDQATPAGGTIADHLQLPFITICNALLINQEATVPTWFTAWSYNPAWWAQLRNRISNGLVRQLTQSIWKQVNHQRQQWQLPLYTDREDYGSQLAQLCQLPAEFDFPRTKLAQCFHYVGPLQDPSGMEPLSFPSVSFPFESLTGEPLVYASLGTLQNRRSEIFQTIAAACVGLNLQLVISLGNPKRQDLVDELPGSPLIVAYAPHQQLINRSALVITHAGMNTTLAALSSGVPLIAIPITNEQPGIAARLARTGAGEVIGLKSLTSSKLRMVIDRVLNEASYQQNAVRLQRAIRQAGGVQRAADIIEQVTTTGKPVFRPV